MVENKPGANGAIGVQSVMASPPDGYTLLLHGSAGVTIYQAVMKQPAFDTLRDLTPISLVIYFDLILCANPALPFKTVKEFVAYAKANPGKLSYGTAGVGAMNHVGTEWFKGMARHRHRPRSLSRRCAGRGRPGERACSAWRSSAPTSRSR